MILNPTIVTDIKGIIKTARDKAIRAVDSERVIMYWHIGQRIFLEEQEGKDRADYGKFLIKGVSEQLQPEFGSGYSIRQLERYRQFYRLFPITSTLSTQLSWSHYMHLLGIENQNGRDFYIAETVKNNLMRSRKRFWNTKNRRLHLQNNLVYLPYGWIANNRS